MLQDEPIRETRENLIPFRRMIKGRKSLKQGKILHLTNFAVCCLLLLKLVSAKDFQYTLCVLLFFFGFTKN